jgi:hypothetical protein
MTSDKGRTDAEGRPGDPAHDSPKRQGDKLEHAVGSGGTALAPDNEAGAPTADSPKRHGDKLEHARDAAAGRKDT